MDKFLEVEEKENVRGYVPLDWVKSINENSEIETMPVKYKNKMEYFVFIKRGYALLKEKVKTVLDIPIYSLEDFNYL